MTPNQQAFLDMIAVSELGRPLIAISDRGYNVIVGSTAQHPDLFSSYADHPRKLVDLGHGLYSTAAGRYQLLARYYDVYKRQLDLPDFSPASQDAIALQQIREREALDLIERGAFAAAVQRCSNIWASLPGNTYGQHQNDIAMLQEVYQQAGGVLA